MKIMNIGSRTEKQELPLVPLRELIILPHMVVPFFTTREKTIKAIEACMGSERLAFTACELNDTEDPEMEDLHSTGTIIRILQVLKLPDNSIRVLAEGKQRAVIKKLKYERDYSFVQVEPIEPDTSGGKTHAQLMTTILKSFTVYAQSRKNITKEVLSAAEKAEYPDKLIDIILANTNVRKEVKLELLSITDTEERLNAAAVMIAAELEMQELQNKITTRVKKKLEKNQREYYLNEQLKEINKELGRDESSETEEFLSILESKKPPQEIMDRARKEAARLQKLQPMSPESGVVRTYLEWLSDLPWGLISEENRDINRAAEILDEDHFNMKKPKDRILDYIAVRQLKENMKGPILCFVGPPGTGKTSLGKSVARALGRSFVRISLGGVRDEAEIRGHRKTYVGALPGKIIQAVKKAGTANSVILLDEIDKLSSDFKGDPASAMLEVLDPEQNNSFVDHYIEVPYDLSGIIFITTANSIHNIPYPLRDRMEIIEIPGYTDLEKFRIASDFIIPRQKEENGLSGVNIEFQRSAVLKIIHNYTMESGVRNLEREIASILRKTAREAMSANQKLDENFRRVITAKTVKKYLGKERFQDDIVYKEQIPGLAHGLAWTEMGGTLLPVETALIEGKGDFILTGSLGDVMKESARTALSFVRSSYGRFGLEKDFYKDKSIHIHVPEGAIPKDGPSAGITITAALLSLFKNIPIKKGIAMTGEITLTGRILPIGGLKEKTLAAYRNKMTDIILPEGNRKDKEELPQEVTSALTFHFVKSAEEAFGILFEREA